MSNQSAAGPAQPDTPLGPEGEGRGPSAQTEGPLLGKLPEPVRKRGRSFKRFFLRGLAAFLPAMLTLLVLFYIFEIIQTYIGRFISDGVYFLLRQTPLDERLAREIWEEYFGWWVGFLLAVVAIYLFGRFVASWVGRSIWQATEGMLIRAPVIRKVYPHVKQVTDFLLSERKLEFSRVVAVEYPRKGVWSVGLLTATGMRSIREHTGQDMVTVFVPSSPTPFTGYTITVERSETVDLPLTIDEAIRFVISGGVLLPGGQLPSGSLAEEGGSKTMAVSTPADSQEGQTLPLYRTCGGEDRTSAHTHTGSDKAAKETAE